MYMKHVVAILAMIATVTSQTNRDKIQLGLSTVTNDTINGIVTVDSGTVPAWINGYFLRQSCGTFGDTHLDIEENLVSHLFDCIPMGTSFHFKQGVITFSQKYWDTATADIWKFYNMNMSDSKIYYNAIYTEMNEQRYNQWLPYYRNVSKPGRFPSVTWWDIKGSPVGVTEVIGGVLVDLENFAHKGQYPFEDNNLGYPPGSIFTNAPAHEAVDGEGVLWHSTAMTTLSAFPTGSSRHVVYRLENNTRIVVGEYQLPSFDLSRCTGGPYPDHEAMYGYMHSFVVTENYVILPVTSYLQDPCQTFLYRGLVPFYKASFAWHPERPGRFLVMRKTDGLFLADIDTDPLFVTHQANAYEENGKIIMDMIEYADSSIYERSFYVKTMLTEETWNASLTRFVIDTNSWTLEERRHLRTPAYDDIEFIAINPAYVTRKYNYNYFLKNSFKNGGGVIKKNVETGEEIAYTVPADFFAHEPVFVATPSAQSEDDGALLLQGYDSNLKKAKLVILNAQTLEEIAIATAPDLALFGLHNRFFARDYSVDVYSCSLSLHMSSAWTLVLATVIQFVRKL